MELSRISVVVAILVAIVSADCGCLQCSKNLRVVSPPNAPCKIIYRGNPNRCTTTHPIAVQTPVIPPPVVPIPRDFNYQIQGIVFDTCEEEQPQNNFEYQVQVPVLPPPVAPVFLQNLRTRPDRVVMDAPNEDCSSLQRNDQPCRPIFEYPANRQRVVSSQQYVVNPVRTVQYVQMPQRSGPILEALNPNVFRQLNCDCRYAASPHRFKRDVLKFKCDSSGSSPSLTSNHRILAELVDVVNTFVAQTISEKLESDRGRSKGSRIFDANSALSRHLQDSSSKEIRGLRTKRYSIQNERGKLERPRMKHRAKVRGPRRSKRHSEIVDHRPWRRRSFPGGAVVAFTNGTKASDCKSGSVLQKSRRGQNSAGLVESIGKFCPLSNCSNEPEKQIPSDNCLRNSGLISKTACDGSRITSNLLIDFLGRSNVVRHRSEATSRNNYFTDRNDASVEVDTDDDQLRTSFTVDDTSKLSELNKRKSRAHIGFRTNVVNDSKIAGGNSAPEKYRTEDFPDNVINTKHRFILKANDHRSLVPIGSESEERRFVAINKKSKFTSSRLGTTSDKSKVYGGRSKICTNNAITNISITESLKEGSEYVKSEAVPKRRSKRDLPLLRGSMNLLMGLLPTFMKLPIKHTLNKLRYRHQLAKPLYPLLKSQNPFLVNQNPSLVVSQRSHTKKHHHPQQILKQPNHHFSPSSTGFQLQSNPYHFGDHYLQNSQQIPTQRKPVVPKATLLEKLEQINSDDNFLYIEDSVMGSNEDQRLNQVHSKQQIHHKHHTNHLSHQHRHVTRSKRSIVDGGEMVLPFFRVRRIEKDESDDNNNFDDSDDDIDSKQSSYYQSDEEEEEDSSKIEDGVSNEEIDLYNTEVSYLQQKQQEFLRPLHFGHMIPHSPLYYFLNVPIRFIHHFHNGFRQISPVFKSVPEVLVSSRKYLRTFGKEFRDNVLDFASNMIGEFDDFPVDSRNRWTLPNGIHGNLYRHRRNRRSLVDNSKKSEISFEPEYTLVFGKNEGSSEEEKMYHETVNIHNEHRPEVLTQQDAAQKSDVYDALAFPLNRVNTVVGKDDKYYDRRDKRLDKTSKVLKIVHATICEKTALNSSEENKNSDESEDGVLFSTMRNFDARKFKTEAYDKKSDNQNFNVNHKCALTLTQNEINDHETTTRHESLTNQKILSPTKGNFQEIHMEQNKTPRVHITEKHTITVRHNVLRKRSAEEVENSNNTSLPFEPEYTLVFGKDDEDDEETTLLKAVNASKKSEKLKIPEALESDSQIQVSHPSLNTELSNMQSSETPPELPGHLFGNALGNPKTPRVNSNSRQINNDFASLNGIMVNQKPLEAITEHHEAVNVDSDENLWNHGIVDNLVGNNYVSFDSHSPIIGVFEKPNHSLKLKLHSASGTAETSKCQETLETSESNKYNRTDTETQIELTEKTRPKRYILKVVDEDEVQQFLREKLGSYFHAPTTTLQPPTPSLPPSDSSEKEAKKGSSKHSKPKKKKLVVEKLQSKLLFDNKGRAFIEIDGVKRPLFPSSYQRQTTRQDDKSEAGASGVPTSSNSKDKSEEKISSERHDNKRGHVRGKERSHSDKGSYEKRYDRSNESSNENEHPYDSSNDYDRERDYSDETSTRYEKKHDLDYGNIDSAEKEQCDDDSKANEQSYNDNRSDYDNNRSYEYKIRKSYEVRTGNDSEESRHADKRSYKNTGNFKDITYDRERDYNDNNHVDKSELYENGRDYGNGSNNGHKRHYNSNRSNINHGKRRSNTDGTSRGYEKGHGNDDNRGNKDSRRVHNNKHKNNDIHNKENRRVYSSDVYENESNNSESFKTAIERVLRMEKHEEKQASEANLPNISVSAKIVRDRISETLSNIQSLLDFEPRDHGELYNSLGKLQYFKDFVVADWRKLQEDDVDVASKIRLLNDFREMSQLRDECISEVTKRLSADTPRCVVKTLIRILVRLQKLQCVIQSVVEDFASRLKLGTPKIIEYLNRLDFVDDRRSTRVDIEDDMKRKRDHALKRELQRLACLRTLLDRPEKLRDEARLLWEIRNVEKLQREVIAEMDSKLKHGLKIRKELRILFDLLNQQERSEDLENQLLEGSCQANASTESGEGTPEVNEDAETNENQTIASDRVEKSTQEHNEKKENEAEADAKTQEIGTAENIRTKRRPLKLQQSLRLQKKQQQKSKENHQHVESTTKIPPHKTIIEDKMPVRIVSNGYAMTAYKVSDDI